MIEVGFSHLGAQFLCVTSVSSRRKSNSFDHMFSHSKVVLKIEPVVTTNRSRDGVVLTKSNLRAVAVLDMASDKKRPADVSP